MSSISFNPYDFELPRASCRACCFAIALPRWLTVVLCVAVVVLSLVSFGSAAADEEARRAIIRSNDFQRQGVEVWIDLAMPPLSARTSLSTVQRAAYRQEIDASQSALIELLRRWGAQERARVQIVRNAIVVEVPESALEEIRKLPGVARVQAVNHRNRLHMSAARSP
ncbi:MAG: hypothetical protein IPF94_15300 [Betaproteobacteria bacterium]|nr:hypothetical protein [Betaproteobacteria bacterium]